MKLFGPATSEIKYPTGRIPCYEQLEWGVLYGGHLEGTGGTLEDSEHRENCGTRLVHEFDKDTPTLLYQSFNGSIDRVTFSGDKRLNDCPRDEYSEVGILVDKAPNSGFGTGKLALKDVSITQYLTAIQLGLLDPDQPPSTEENADNLTAWRLHTHRCETMLRVVHEQGVDIHIALARPYKTPLVFDFEGGGNLNCQSLRAMTGVETILRLGDGVGSNNGKFVIGEGGVVVVDSNNDVPVFLRQTKRCAALEVTFQNVRTGNRARWPNESIFQMKGGCSLTINGFKSLRPFCIEFQNTPGSSNDDIAKYRNHVHLQKAFTSGVASLDQLFATSSRGECTVTVGAVTNVYGETTIRPGRYKIKATSAGIEIVEQPGEQMGISDLVLWFDSRIDAVGDRLTALEDATPPDLAPLESRVGEIENAVHQTEQQLDKIGTAFRNVANGLLPVDDADRL